MTERNNIKHHHNSGMTMLETLAAFAILMIITASLIGIIQFSSNMSMDAADRRALGEELNERLAHKTGDVSVEPAFNYVPLTDGMESNLELVLDTEKTSVNNYSGGGAETIELRGCDVYLLPFPTETAPEITVLRLAYNSAAY